MKIKKVLLFIPPAFTFKDNVDINPLPPLGLGYLAAVLEQRGIEVKIVDCLMEGWHIRKEVKPNIIRAGLSLEAIEGIINDFRPDIVGVNNLFTRQRQNAHDIYRLAKKMDERIITIAGGAHPSIMPDLVMSDPNVDFAVIGEGEGVLVRLLSVLENGGNISELDGVAFRSASGIVVNPKLYFIVNLDTIAFPARHLMHMENYCGLKASHGMRRKDRFSPVITSRGCPARCTFCSAHAVWGRKYRYRSPENVIAELKQLKEMGIQEIMFEDDNLTLNRVRAEKIFDLMVQEKLNLVWDTPNGVAAYSLDESLIDKMKASGCYQLNLALESGSQYVLDKFIKKPLDLEKGKRLVRYAQSIGLGVSIYLIVGMPGETKEQIWETFKMARELRVYTPTISVATPYLGSELYELCKEHGYLSPNFSMDDLYITSYSISTEDWTADELKRIVATGRKYLLMGRMKAHPIEGMKAVWSAFANDPKTFLGRTLRFVR